MPMPSTESTGNRTGRQKVERLEARISRQQKELFKRAAELQGRTLTDFVIDSVEEAAQRTVRQYEVIRLTAEDREVFVSALLADAEPSPHLSAAYRRYKDRMER